MSIDAAAAMPGTLYARVVAPSVGAIAPALLAGYRSPFGGRTYVPGSSWTPEQARAAATRDSRGHQPGSEPVLFAGFVISNSEVGDGARSITPRIVAEICGNGLQIAADVTRAIHLGSRQEQGIVRYSADTRDKELALITARARDAVARFFPPASACCPGLPAGPGRYRTGGRIRRCARSGPSRRRTARQHQRGHVARIRDQMTDPFPAPVAPATRTWEPSSRSSHGDHPHTGRSPARPDPLGRGWAGPGPGRRPASRRISSSTISPGAAGRTRHRWTLNPCARPSARSAKSAGDWPDTSLTVTRSTGPHGRNGR